MIIAYGTYSSRKSSQPAPDVLLGKQHTFGPSAGFGEWYPAPPEDGHRAFMVFKLGIWADPCSLVQIYCPLFLGPSKSKTAWL